MTGLVVFQFFIYLNADLNSSSSMFSTRTATFACSILSPHLFSVSISFSVSFFLMSFCSFIVTLTDPLPYLRKFILVTSQSAALCFAIAYNLRGSCLDSTFLNSILKKIHSDLVLQIVSSTPVFPLAVPHLTKAPLSHLASD